MISPAAGSTFAAGASIVLEADVTDADGWIDRVEFFQGSTLLGTVRGFPFRFTWSAASSGTYSLLAIATDNSGTATTSPPVSITVSGGANQPPTVTMISPSDGSSFGEGTPVLLEADAADSDGTVARVEFFDAATSLGTVDAAPYRLTWTASTPGNHSLRAVATDAAGATTSSSAVVVTVTPPVTPSGTLQGVFFADGSRGWIVGEGGRIYATTDGGTTWFAQDSGTTADLARVQFVSATRGWVVGTGGTILSTSNGGATWSAQPSGTTDDLRGLSFVSATQGWVVGGERTALRTTDGGATWSTQNIPLFRWAATASFISPTMGWVAGADQVASTSDGGATWSLKEVSFIGSNGFVSSPSIFDIRSMSAMAGTLVGASHDGDVIMTTRDGWSTWTTIQLSPPTTALLAVTFGDAGHWWTVGATGRIGASADGGLTWSLQTSPVTSSLLGVWFVNANLGWAVGWYGTVIRTTDGGSTWTLVAGGT